MKMLKWVVVVLRGGIIYDCLLGIYNSYEDALFFVEQCEDEDIELGEEYYYKIEGVELR